MDKWDDIDTAVDELPSNWAAVRTIVLLSGGIDSTLCLAMMREDQFQPVGAMFIDYGQLARRSESTAAIAIADHYRVPLLRLRILGGPRPAAGVISARNALLVTSALFASPTTLRMIVLGIHAGTAYPDCGHMFAQTLSAMIHLYRHDSVVLSTPLIDFYKQDICRMAAERQIPLDLTHSCDTANAACSLCSSCRDKEAFLART